MSHYQRRFYPLSPGSLYRRAVRNVDLTKDSYQDNLTSQFS